MRQTNAKCEQIELIGNRVRVYLSTDLALVPGQFALARLAETFDPYLRQPLFPSLMEPGSFAVDLAPNDPALHFLSPGITIDLLGPIGAAPASIPSQSRLLLVAETDPAVLLPFAARAIDSGGAATLVLSAQYPLDAIRPEIELHVSPIEIIPALVTELAAVADFIFIQATSQLSQAIYQSLNNSASFVTIRSAYAFVPCAMPCGVGACGACYTKTTRGWKLACLSGPFFPLADLNG